LAQVNRKKTLSDTIKLMVLCDETEN